MANSTKYVLFEKKKIKYNKIIGRHDKYNKIIGGHDRY